MKYRHLKRMNQIDIITYCGITIAEHSVNTKFIYLFADNVDCPKCLRVYEVQIKR